MYLRVLLTLFSGFCAFLDGFYGFLVTQARSPCFSRSSWCLLCEIQTGKTIPDVATGYDEDYEEFDRDYDVSRRVHLGERRLENDAKMTSKYVKNTGRLARNGV